MQHMKKVTLRFSVIWCIGVFLLHIGVTLLLGMVMFAAAMGSFTHGSGVTYYAAKAVMWVWSPLVMLMVEGHLRAVPSPEIIACIWSLAVGMLTGLIGGTLRKPGKDMQDVSAGNSDLIGTPWAHDSGFTLGDSTAQNEEAEQVGGCDGEQPRG